MTWCQAEKELTSWEEIPQNSTNLLRPLWEHTAGQSSAKTTDGQMMGGTTH